jgi:hypothetical protein
VPFKCDSKLSLPSPDSRSVTVIDVISIRKVPLCNLSSSVLKIPLSKLIVPLCAPVGLKPLHSIEDSTTFAVYF